jgi:hypothetical protein
MEKSKEINHNNKLSHRGIHPFSNVSLQFGNIAKAYYPELGYKAALRLFRKELQLSKKLWEALQEAGYKGNERILTLNQYRIIYEYLGEP